VNPRQKTPPTFVFVHGFLDGAAIWRPLSAALHTPESHSHAVDLAGMGGRPQEAGPYTRGRYANDVIAVIDGLSGPVVLVGHSIGTLIAELAAVERPDKVVALAPLTPMPLAGAHLPEGAVAPFKSVGGSAAAQRALRLQASPHFPEQELPASAKRAHRSRPTRFPGSLICGTSGYRRDNNGRPFPGPYSS
jgi:esterase